MIEVILTILLSFGIYYMMHKRFEKEEAARNAEFEATMRALEEKAKKDGTFKVSYFDKEKK